MKKILPILLLIFSCDEANVNTTSLGSDGTAIQDTIIIQQDTTIINIIYDTTIIVMDTIIYNYPPSVVITSPISQSLDSTTVIRAEAIDDTGISNVKFLIGGVNADGSMILVFTDSFQPYEYEWDICSYSDGFYSVLAKAQDLDGIESYSELVQYGISGDYDCAGICGGDAVVDCCNVCEGITECDTCGDCPGVNLEEDECGVCGGDGSSCSLDIDGNVYTTIQIGEQFWMRQNLKVTRYNNGNPIPTGYSNSEWSALETGAYTVYDDDPLNADIYGNLYNWYTVDGEGFECNTSSLWYNTEASCQSVCALGTCISSDGGLCPEGWHVPSDEEWTILADYLGGASVAGGKLKEEGTEHWWYSPNSATNESGFTALPGGSCSGDDCTNLGKKTFYWSATGTLGNATLRYLNYDNSMIDSLNQSMNSGLSVRCVAD